MEIQALQINVINVINDNKGKTENNLGLSFSGAFLQCAENSLQLTKVPEAFHGELVDLKKDDEEVCESWKTIDDYDEEKIDELFAKITRLLKKQK